MGLLERLGLRGKPKTGLNQQFNSLINTVIMAGPPYILIFAVQYLDYLGIPQDYQRMILLMGVALWASGIYGYTSHMKMEVAGYLAFPQSKWRFDESTTKTLDVLIPENAIRYLGPLDKKKKNPGKHVYLVGPVPITLGYDHPDFGLISFNRAFFIQPDVWDETFFFTPGGEIWWKGVSVDHPQSEGLVLHVLGWEDYMGEMIPICKVADSNLHYKHSKGAVDGDLDSKFIVTVDDVEMTKSMELKRENIELRLKVKDLSHHLDKVLQESVDVEEILNMRIADGKRRHGTVMRMGKPLKYRLLNLRTFGLVILLIFIIAVLGRGLQWW